MVIIYLHDFKQINLFPFEICRGKIYKSWIHDNDRPPLACKCCRNWCRSCNVLAWRILNVQGIKFQKKVIFLGIISWFVLGKRQIVQAKEFILMLFQFRPLPFWSACYFMNKTTRTWNYQSPQRPNKLCKVSSTFLNSFYSFSRKTLVHIFFFIKQPVQNGEYCNYVGVSKMQISMRKFTEVRKLNQ